MRFVVTFLIVFLTIERTCAEELFSARCESSLTKSSASWRLTETKGSLTVEYSDAKKKNFSVVASSKEAEVLRSKVASLQLVQADIDFLRSQSVTHPAKKKEDETVIFRPFDGVTYYFSIRTSAGVRSFWIDNPDFDLEYHAKLKETALLKEVLTFLEFLERRAKGQKETKQPEPAPQSRGVL